MSQEAQDLRPTPAQQAIARRIRQRLNEAAPLDSLLEELARQQQMIDELAAELRVLRAQNIVRDVLLPQALTQYRGADTASVDAGMPLDDSTGFYPLEYDEMGQPFRWTGPSPAFHFDLHVDRSGPLRFQLVLNAGAGFDPASTRAFSDGVELPCEVADLGSRLELSGLLMPRESLGLTRLYFMPTRMFRPDEDGRSTDSRALGVVFREVRVGPVDDETVRRHLARADLAARQRAAQAELLTAPLPAPVAGPDAEVAPDEPAAPEDGPATPATPSVEAGAAAPRVAASALRPAGARSRSKR